MKSVLSIVFVVGFICIASGCNEGDKWNDNCNTCTCIRGEPQCTEKLCNGAAEMMTSSLRKSKTTCKKGDKWLEECNECTCTSRGTPACTKMLCENRRLIRRQRI